MAQLLRVRLRANAAEGPGGLLVRGPKREPGIRPFLTPAGMAVQEKDKREGPMDEYPNRDNAPSNLFWTDLWVGQSLI
jgi:hypothetical protein